MTLLNSMFPSLVGLAAPIIPYWEDENAPWEILVDGNGGLKEQISRLIEGNAVVFIDPSARVAKSVMIEGPCYIGPDAEIRHGAYLRGGSWICKGALVGNSSEIKNSILLPGAKAPHFNYVGDSIVGANTNLGAGVKLSNVRNDRGLVSITLFDGKRIETKLNKMGALIGDGSQIGCNTVTNPGSLIAPNSMVNPNETVTGCFGTMS
jgi:NDP-sugar pyrophosphorylase family protein